MALRSRKGPFCQRCMMSIEKPEDFGTNDDGSKSKDYCRFCFQNGEFTKPDIPLEQLIDTLTGFIATQMKIPEAKAKEKARLLIERKNW